MKKLSFKITTLAVAAAILLGSCNKIKDFGDTNVNPAVTSDPITAALLTNVLAGLGGFATQTRGGLYSQYFTETQYTEASLYNAPIADFAGNYSGSLYDLQNIIIYNTNPKTAAATSAYGSNNNQIAVARILKSYIFWHMTDRWGDIPYSQALQGTTPGYDKQEDIYKGLLAELKAAIAQFDAGNGPSGDIIYAGSTAKWKKLANSLRMLIALRMSKVYPLAGQLAATEFALAFNDGAGHITSNADNFVLTYPGGAFSDPWYNLFDGRKDYSESKTMTDLMGGMGDTRVNAFGANTAGFPYGLPRALALAIPEPWPLILSPANRTTTSSVMIVSAAWVLLAKAEGVERGWVAGQTTADAQTYYNAAITESFNYWGYGSSAAAYIAGGSANYASGSGVGAIGGTSVAGSTATTTTKLQRIALQTYIALYPDGAQGWAEWKRSSFPDIKPTVYATNTGGKIPRRMMYGSGEYSLNPAGVAQGIASLTGGDTQDARVWWDKP